MTKPVCRRETNSRGRGYTSILRGWRLKLPAANSKQPVLVMPQDPAEALCEIGHSRATVPPTTKLSGKKKTSETAVTKCISGCEALRDVEIRGDVEREKESSAEKMS